MLNVFYHQPLFNENIATQYFKVSYSYRIISDSSLPVYKPYVQGNFPETRSTGGTYKESIPVGDIGKIMLRLTMIDINTNQGFVRYGWTSLAENGKKISSYNVIRSI